MLRIVGGLSVLLFTTRLVVLDVIEGVVSGVVLMMLVTVVLSVLDSVLDSVEMESDVVGQTSPAKEEEINTFRTEIKGNKKKCICYYFSKPHYIYLFISKQCNHHICVRQTENHLWLRGHKELIVEKCLTRLNVGRMLQVHQCQCE